MKRSAFLASCGALAAFTAVFLCSPAVLWLSSASAQTAKQDLQAVSPQKQSKTRLVEFELSPFPYEGINPATGKPFIDVDETGRRGRLTRRGQVLWEDETFSDQRVLLHIPQGFDIRKPAIIIVFFHGHGAAIDRDVRDRQRIAEQIARSGANAVLVAPQMAVKAADSSAGIFWEQGMFAQFLNEASEQLALLHGGIGMTRIFDRLPVMIVAYSGGYLATAWCVHHGGANDRMKGVVLLDALYGEMDKFERFIAGNRQAFFVSAYLGSTRARNLEMQQTLTGRNLPVANSLGGRIGPGSLVIMPGGPGDNHTDFANKAWGANPVTDILDRLPEYRR
jgi:hypothetical protein